MKNCEKAIISTTAASIRIKSATKKHLLHQRELFSNTSVNQVTRPVTDAFLAKNKRLKCLVKHCRSTDHNECQCILVQWQPTCFDHFFVVPSYLHSEHQYTMHSAFKIMLITKFKKKKTIFSTGPD